MNRKFKIIAIAIAVSLLVSSMVYYFQYVNIQNNSNVYHVQGILSVYKNGKLVHQGPDLLTQWFYQYLPFLLGNVCTVAYSTNCPNGNFANTVFTFPITPIGCGLATNSNPPLEYDYTSQRATPITAVLNPALIIGVGNGNGALPTDCVVNTLQLYQSANIYVYSPFTNNPNGAPFPCPNPTQGCVQINTTFTATSTITLSEAMLYAAYNNVLSGGLFALIAHDIFSQVTLNQGDTLTITYTFIFPGIQTNPGSFNENQGAIAAMFAQCLGRTYFGVGPSTARLCIDSVLPQAPTSIFVFQPSSPCNDMIKPTSIVNRSATISILTSSASKYAKIMAPMFTSGSGTQIVVYNITINNNAYKILEASQVCSVATMNNFTRGQSVGIQLNFP